MADDDPLRHVRVALPVAVDREFTYSLPASLGDVIPGMRVLVPFSGRRLTGIVTGPAADDVPADEVLEVERVLDDIPVIPAPLLELARFIAEYYVCPLGEALRAMHAGGPSGKIIATLTDAGCLAVAGAVRGEKQRLVLLALGDGGVAVPSLTRRFGRGVPALLREMAARGWIELRESVAGGTAPSSEQVWRLAPAAPVAGPVARRGTVAERLRPLLGEHLEGLSVPELARLSGAARSAVTHAVKTLEKQGVAIRGLRAVRREPGRLASREPAGARAGGGRGGEAVRTLSPAQGEALSEICRMIDAGTFSVLLLEGVTGSGKTEVYLRAIEHAIGLGRTGIYLVPEISITPILMRTVRERFGERTAILHSGLSDGERHDERARILAGDVDAVLGARSAVFAPIPRLGILVVDEEHETSYKQDSQPRYHARDAAVMRGRLESTAVVLGSATPSLESYQNADAGRYALRRLPERVGGATRATVELVDMREEWRTERGASPLSRRLRESLAATLAEGRQAMILLNRRGWADFLLCRECGEPERCDHCAVTLTVHLRSGYLLCHYCGLRRDIPGACRSCGGSLLQNVGQGTQQLEEALRALVPGVSIGRLDKDVARRKGAAAHVLAQFEAGSLRVLVGTQMIAKAHDFPNVTLVGVLQADRALWLPDFRAAERTFQLLVQVAGRAGRGMAPGLVIVQTFSPEHPAIVFAQSQDYPRFFESEASHREALGYPPFRRLVAALVSAEDAAAARAAAERLGEALRAEIPGDGVVLGPAPAPIARVKDRSRFQLLVKGAARKALNQAVRRAVAGLVLPEGVRVEVDVDPQSLL